MRTTAAIMAIALVAGLAARASAQECPNPRVIKTPPGTAVPILDPPAPAATVTLTVVDDGLGCNTISDVNVDLIIAHTWQGDLSAWVTHNGVTVSLINRPGEPSGIFGYSADNYGNPATGVKFTLDDEAPGIYDRPPLGIGPNDTIGIANVSGPWQPDPGADAGLPLLSAFDGMSKVGDWTLSVLDNAGGDTGTINNFGLTIGNVPEPASVGLLVVGALTLIRRRRA
ncbi:MAG TPA: proprotein convertase P-domain-containing protein [Phycisphaerae bacterium]